MGSSLVNILRQFLNYPFSSSCNRPNGQPFRTRNLIFGTKEVSDQEVLIRETPHAPVISSSLYASWPGIWFWVIYHYNIRKHGIYLHSAKAKSKLLIWKQSHHRMICCHRYLMFYQNLQMLTNTGCLFRLLDDFPLKERSWVWRCRQKISIREFHS